MIKHYYRVEVIRGGSMHREIVGSNLYATVDEATKNIIRLINERRLSRKPLAAEDVVIQTDLDLGLHYCFFTIDGLEDYLAVIYTLGFEVKGDNDKVKDLISCQRNSTLQASSLKGKHVSGLIEWMRTLEAAKTLKEFIE